MFLFDNEQKYATGLVKPKTTAIFFDKLLITDDLLDEKLSGLGYSDIPNEVLLRPNISPEKHFQIAHELAHYLGDMDFNKRSENDPYRLLNENNQMYKYSTHRNYGISEITEFYRNYGINIIPIYFSPTDYEQHLLANKDKPFLSPTISTCINKIPEIVEDKLTWKQVLEIRKDKESLNKIRSFNNWITSELTDKSEAEITAILEQKLYEYSCALKIHGIETAIDAISIVSSTSLIQALTENTGFLIPGITVGVGVTTLAIKYFINKSFKTKPLPIAIIYDLTKIK